MELACKVFSGGVDIGEYTTQRVYQMLEAFQAAFAGMLEVSSPSSACVRDRRVSAESATSASLRRFDRRRGRVADSSISAKKQPGKLPAFGNTLRGYFADVERRDEDLQAESMTMSLTSSCSPANTMPSAISRSMPH